MKIPVNIFSAFLPILAVHVLRFDWLPVSCMVVSMNKGPKNINSKIL